MPPTALVPLEAIQYGVETTPGTLVAADTQLQLENGGEYAPEIDRVEIEEAHGVLAPTAYLDVRKGTTLNYRHHLDFEQILLPLDCGLKSVTPTGTGPYTYTYDPDPAAVETLKATTFEVSYFDGTTRHLQREFGFGTCNRLVFSGAFNQPAFFEASFFARAPQTSTWTASQAPLSRERIRSNAFALYADPNWAALGTTQKTGLIRSFTLEILPGVAPDWTLDARSDADFTQLARMRTRARLSMTLGYNADGDAEYDAWEANTRRFIELRATGTSSRSLKLQGAFEYITPPRFSTQDDLRIVEMEAEAVYDSTGGQQLNIEVINNIASI